MSNETLREITNQDYKYGFVTDVEMEKIPRGLNEDVVRLISQKKNEPEFMLERRLKAYRHWLTMKEPLGRMFIILKSTIKAFFITRHRSKKKKAPKV